MVPFEIYDCFSGSVRNSFGTFIGMALNLSISVGNTVILTILILPVQDQGISSHSIKFYKIEKERKKRKTFLGSRAGIIGKGGSPGTLLWLQDLAQPDGWHSARFWAFTMLPCRDWLQFPCAQG